MAREERLERLRAEAAKQAEEIAHMEAFVEKFRYKATKAKQVQDRVKKLEKITAHPAARGEEDRALQLQAAAPHGR